MTQEQETNYKVILVGPAHDDMLTVGKVKEGLRDRFKLSSEMADRMMDSAPVTVKKEITLPEAQRYRELLEGIGAAVKIEPAADILESVQEEPQPRRTIPVQGQVPSQGEAAGAEEEARAFRCPQCGFIQPEGRECAKCGVVFAKVPQHQMNDTGLGGFTGVSAAALGVDEDEEDEYTPWEDMANLGFVNAFIQTVTEVLSTPDRFFRKMSGDGILSPLLFAVLSAVVASLFHLLWQYFFAGLFGGVNVSFAKGMLAYGIFLPFLFAVIFFIVTVILHVAVMVVGGNRSGFGATLRVVAYSNSTQLVAILPILGSIFALLYHPVLVIVGLKESHRITMGRAAFAVFVALIVAIILGLILLFMILGPLISAAFQMMMQHPPQY